MSYNLYIWSNSYQITVYTKAMFQALIRKSVVYNTVVKRVLGDALAAFTTRF